MSGNITARKIVSNPVFSMICFLSVCFILPRYGDGIAIMVACASILSLQVLGLPELFRSRNGSMMAATCLVAVMWVEAAVVTALTLMGVIH